VSRSETEYRWWPIFSHTVSVQRISVVGNSGSGKTTLARELASALAVPRLELDSIFHQPGWEPLDDDSFRQRVTAFTAGPSWVVDGNYAAVQDLVWDRADTVLWLDPSRRRVMRQVIWRTLRRVATRAELWNGNREPWTNLFRVKPEESIIAWAWTKHLVYQQRYLSAQADPANSHLTFVRLRTVDETAAIVRRAAGEPPLGDPAGETAGDVSRDG
jgi:adenylate kinase family enzyme